MERYSVDGNQNAAAAVTILGVTRGASKRISLVYLTHGSAATAADQALNMQINRTTAAGTSTAVTPRPQDSAAGASVATAGENHTSEPTKTADLVMLSFSHNTRSNFQWYAEPSKGFTVPDTANNGLALVTIVTTGSQLCEATFFIDE